MVVFPRWRRLAVRKIVRLLLVSSLGGLGLRGFVRGTRRAVTGKIIAQEDRKGNQEFRKGPECTPEIRFVNWWPVGRTRRSS